MKIELYTCKDGISLFNRGRSFGVWNEFTRSYNESDENIKILVDEKDLKEMEFENGAFDVINIESVEIIG